VSAPIVSVLEADGTAVCARCELAKNPYRRLKGLLGRRGLGEGEGLLIRPTSSIHTWFMRFPIDVVFLDRDLRVVRVAENVRPWRLAHARGAKLVLELPSGAAAQAGVGAGDQLVISEPESSPGARLG
jgi:uncharacterized membrane protein (UPF0127 family)